MTTSDAISPQERLKRAALIIRRLEERLAPLERAEQDRTDPVAVIGLGCRFPGGASTPAAYWDLLDSGRDASAPLEPRWTMIGAHPGPDAPRWAGLLTEPIEGFDAAFFGITPREARALDPQHRLLLELAWETLEDAGVPPQSLEGSRTGVFIGASSTEYRYLVERQPREDQDLYAATGNMLSLTAGRLSYTLGLQGPCLAVDTACSSSLVAIHLACKSLVSRESDLALAGGVELILSPSAMDVMSRLQALSPDGRCRTFDAGANGFARGEGCGLIALKRLADARRDGDRIWALLRGSAINQDGRSTGLTAPNAIAQEALLREALAIARVPAGSITYVETHGTATPLGDPIEVEALRAVLGAPRPDGTTCVLGAVKTNIGHLHGAAGVAGLIKAVLALHHERIPQNLHFQQQNPRMRLTDTALTLATAPVPWPRGAAPRRCGVSSFGMSGTNAHVILEEAPAAPEALVAAAEPPAATAELCVLSARSAAALEAQAARLASHLRAHPSLALADLAFSLATTRTHLEHRLAVAASSTAALHDVLAATAGGELPPDVVHAVVPPGGRPKVVFVFPGQGSQWVGMGQRLLVQEPAYRAALEACDRAIADEAGWSVLAALSAGDATSQLGPAGHIDVVQPVLFAVEVALAALWRSWGIEPDVVVGHSMGEVAAAHVAGALTLADAAAIICRRSRLLRRISGQGEMAVVELSRADAEAALAGYEDRVSVAITSGPHTTVLSGEPAALSELLAALESRSIFCRRVKVDVASHSPQVEPLRRDLVAALEHVRPAPATVPMRSTVTGDLVRGPELLAAYWMDNLRQPVRFAETVAALLADGHGLFVELSPHPILLSALEELRHAAGVSGASVGSLRRGQDERQVLLEALGTLWVHGHAITWCGVHRAGARRVPLPEYAWQRERHWLDGALTDPAASVPAAAPLGRATSADGPDLLAPLAAAAPAERAILLRAHVLRRVSQVLRIPEAKLDAGARLTGLGMDSLMAVELKHRLQRDTSVEVPLIQLLSELTITRLGQLLDDELPMDAPASAARPAATTWVDIEL